MKQDNIMYKPTAEDLVIYCHSAEFCERYEQADNRECIRQISLQLESNYSLSCTEKSICSVIADGLRDDMKMMSWSEDDIEGVTWFIGIYTHAILMTRLASNFKNQTFSYISRACMCTYFNIDYTTPPNIISKEAFKQLEHNALSQQTILQAIEFKKYIQTAILPFMTDEEVEDLRNCRKNEEVVERLCQLGFIHYKSFYGATSIYACAVAIATIIKEYEWGMEYLSTDGLYNLATRIQSYDIVTC